MLYLCGRSVVNSIGSEQKFEILAEKIDVLGPADVSKCLAAQKTLFRFLREKAHLRFRTNTFSAVFRLEHATYAIHSFFNEEGLLAYIHPLLQVLMRRGLRNVSSNQP